MDGEQLRLFESVQTIDQSANILRFSHESIPQQTEQTIGVVQ